MIAVVVMQGGVGGEDVRALWMWIPPPPPQPQPQPQPLLDDEEGKVEVGGGGVMAK